MDEEISLRQVGAENECYLLSNMLAEYLFIGPYDQAGLQATCLLSSVGERTSLLTLWEWRC